MRRRRPLPSGGRRRYWSPVSFPTGPQSGSASFNDWRAAESWLDAAGGELADVVGHAAAHGEADFACWIAEALCDYFVRQGRYHESQTALEIAFAQVGAAADRRMDSALRTCLAYTAVHQRRYRQARALFAEALDLSRQRRDPVEEAHALTGLASVDVSVGEGDRAIPRLTAALAVCRQRGDDWMAWMDLVILGLVHYFGRRNEEAPACFAEARVHAERRGSRPRMLGRVLSCAADVHLRLGAYGEAKALLSQAVHLAREVGDVFLCARSLTRLGTAEEATGNAPAALALHRQALLQHQLLSPVTAPGYDWLEMDIRTRLARAYLATGRLGEAREQFQAVLTVRDARTTS